VDLDRRSSGSRPLRKRKSVRGKKPDGPLTKNRRATERQVIAIAARLAWKDKRGINRFASVVTRNVSESGVFIECPSLWPIPLFRLMHFQVEPTAGRLRDLPEALRQGRILSAVYRVSHDTRTGRYGIALRLMVDPTRRTTEQTESAWATA
jgi:hypothetical protein